MKQVKIIEYASPICWWMGCKNQICPVLDEYKPTGYMKIRVKRYDLTWSRDEQLDFEGWISPEYVEEVTE